MVFRRMYESQSLIRNYNAATSQSKELNHEENKGHRVIGNTERVLLPAQGDFQR